MTETDNDININCSICTDDLEIKPKRWCVKNNKDIKTLECNHQYHTECIDTWLENHNTCPLCRHEVKTVSEIYVSSNERNLERNVERNNFINKIKNNKRYVMYFIFYILLLSGAIAHIITLSTSINYIEKFNNNSSNVFNKEKIINNFIVITVYVAFLTILLFFKISLKNNSCINNSSYAFCGPSIIMVLTICYIYYNVFINNDLKKHIKLFDDTNKKENEYIILRNLIVLIYDSVISSLYVLFVYYFVEICRF